MEDHLWMTLMVFTFCLPVQIFTQQLHTTNCIGIPLSIQLETLHSQVFIACPNMTGAQVRFHLLGSVSQSIRTIHTTMLQNQNPNQTRKYQLESRTHFHPSERSHNQSLPNRYELMFNGTGSYACKAQRLWPPPYEEDIIHTLLIEEKQCLNHQVITDRGEVPEGLFLWLTLCGCSVLFLYSTIITIITIVILKKQKKIMCEQNIYMNTTTGEMRAPKRAH
ncbi:hypothetical protein UPYG_G00160100 [Umbra pygmaea]|uniref:Uncharacterized protein n=1 Tax=Umbra pygmaea TaxID=75934 RepID=A0ABD0X352_UMBPY